MGSYSVYRHARHLKGHPGWCPTLKFSVSGVWWASLSIVQLPMLACEERGAMVIAPPPMHDSAVSPCFHGCPASLHRHFPPQSPSSHPFDLSLCSQQQPCPGITPQSLNSSSQPLSLPGDLHPRLEYVWLRQGLSDSYSI